MRNLNVASKISVAIILLIGRSTWRRSKRPLNRIGHFLAEKCQISVGKYVKMWDGLETGFVALNATVQKHLSISVSLDVIRMTNAQVNQATQAATAVLAESSVRELRSLRVDRSANDLQLTGRVRSFYHKQLAQEAVRQVAGGMQVVNRVDVAS